MNASVPDAATASVSSLMSRAAASAFLIEIGPTHAGRFMWLKPGSLSNGAAVSGNAAMSPTTIAPDSPPNPCRRSPT